MNRRLSYHEQKGIISGTEAFCYLIDRYVRHEKEFSRHYCTYIVSAASPGQAGSKENVKAVKPVKDGLIGETNN
jgi:hypothetical protein